MTGIFYFSSTGNSLYIAKRIKEKLGGNVFYIPDFKKKPEKLDRAIIVSPVYSFGLPVPVYDFISDFPFDCPCFLILNYGGMAGGADRLAYELAKKRGVDMRGVYLVKMPENFTLTFTSPRFYNNIILRSAPARIDAICEKIKTGEHSSPKSGSVGESTYYKNKENWHLLARDFSVSEDCVLCGKCAVICPAKNIRLESGRVEFLDNCIACLGCYHRCPKKAIVYKKHRKKDRYMNPHIKEGEIGRDL